MQNKTLAYDHIMRAEKRLKAVRVLVDEKSWADVVRESQEVVELALKALLRASFIAVPRVHDVSNILLAEKEKLPKKIHGEISKLCRISKNLRRDRELAFYGSEDLTPSEFYSAQDGKEAFNNAKTVVTIVKPHVSK